MKNELAAALVRVDAEHNKWIADGENLRALRLSHVALKYFPIGTRVRLSGGRLGQVIGHWDSHAEVCVALDYAPDAGSWHSIKELELL